MSLPIAHIAVVPAGSSRAATRSCGSSCNPSCGSVSRRAVLAGTAPLLTLPAAASANSKSRTTGYEVQRTDREWAYVLSGQQYFVLRQGGTEPPNSSPLVKEKRAGTFECAACGSGLFDASQKFESGTGWPSFASPLEAVETEQVNPLAAGLLGAELRCSTCGGHLGDVFLDGLLFPGTPAALTGKRYCIDGAALSFRPADGSPLVAGDAPASTPPELPAWLQPPKVGQRVG